MRPIDRPGSPEPGFSILTTSAPSQASASVQDGPASNWVRSRILRPARQFSPLIVDAHVYLGKPGLGGNVSTSARCHVRPQGCGARVNAMHQWRRWVRAPYAEANGMPSGRELGTSGWPDRMGVRAAPKYVLEREGTI